MVNCNLLKFPIKTLDSPCFAVIQRYDYKSLSGKVVQISAHNDKSCKRTNSIKEILINDVRFGAFTPQVAINYCQQWRLFISIEVLESHIHCKRDLIGLDMLRLMGIHVETLIALGLSVARL